MHGSYQSYRTYRFPWTGTPSDRARDRGRHAHTPEAAATVYASWNGATAGRELARARGPLADAARAGGHGRPRGFETAIATPGAAPYVAVQALEASGAVLSTSATIKG